MQILTPLPNDWVGPGSIVQARTDFIGPIELGSRFQFITQALPREVLVGRGAIYSQTAETTGWLGLVVNPPLPTASDLLPQAGIVASPQDATLVVGLQSPTNAVLDQASVPVKWQPSPAGVAWLQAQLSQTVTEGGFTEADRSVATQTNAAVMSTFINPVTGLDELVPIGNFFQRPPLEVLALQESVLISGRGSLNRPPGGPQLEAYGALLRLVQVPAGFGVRAGVVPEYQHRVVQLAVIGRHGNTRTFVSSLFDLNHGGQYLRWDAPFPRRLDYDVTPGCTVELTWLSWGIQS